ncbi:FG-GAP repeat domain-containing protein [Singulisphaera sp. PoT]|uniref:FG-GAP repeat domain-containing protein n=1 Tax=Singulisphaera sp. PoT TaxID=3411797 RepID=UPI003BF51F11
MASVDYESSTNEDGQGEPETSPASQAKAPRFSWDASVAATPIGQGWDAEPVAVNWSGNGAVDLLVTSGGGEKGRTARIYKRISHGEAGLRYDAGTVVEALAGLRCVNPLPNGGASRFDLVAIDDDGLVLVRNLGDGGEPRWAEPKSLGIPADLGMPSAHVVQIVALDWDGDGLTDLLVGVDDLAEYWPDSDRLPESQQVGFNQKGGHPGYDHNGSWRGKAPSGRILWLRNLGRPGEPAFELQPEIHGDAGPLDMGLHPAAMTISWGGGGSVEFLLSDNRGDVRIYRNFGGQRPPVLMEPRTLQSGHGALLLPEDRTTVTSSDLDGDGRPELLFGRTDGRVFAVHAGATRKDAKAPVPIEQAAGPLNFGGHAVVTAADLDDDGDLDLIYGDAAGRLFLVEDAGEGSEHRYKAPVELEAGGIPFRIEPGPDGMLEGPIAHRLGYACPTLVDWSDNGRLDLIIGGASGEICYLRNDGAANSPRFGSPSRIRLRGGPLILPPRVRPATADWSGDGTIDLIALDLQGHLCVYPRVDSYEVGEPTPLVDRLGRYIRLDGAFGLAGLCSLWAGRWTGKEELDLLVGLPRGNRHVIPALTGEPLMRVDDLPTVLLLENLGHGRLIPRPIRHQDGKPLIVGSQGCSPMGVNARGDGTLDLLVGSDQGELLVYPREELTW